MVGMEFIDLLAKYQLNSDITVEDFSEKLHLLTSLLFLVAAFTVTVKQYIFNSISCYIPVQPTGHDFSDFLADYCWVHGTIPLRANERMPKTLDEWDLYDKYRRISKRY